MIMQKTKITPPNYSQAKQRLQQRRQRSNAADNISQIDLPKLVRRLVINATNAPLVVSPGLAIKIEKGSHNENPFAIDPPYGILPTLITASPEELIEAADKYSVAKYEFLRRGDFYRSWQASWRQRLIEQVLQNITSIGISAV
jgi:hypothetical protein